MQTNRRKRRTRGHVIADLSINHVERHILQCGWTVQRFSPDYGVDLLMTTFDRQGEVENGEVRLQVKASDSVIRKVSNNTISVRVEWRDMIYWLNERLPVILVIYDAKSDCAWWIYLNKLLRQQGRSASMAATLTMNIPVENVLDGKAIRRFRRFRDMALSQSEG